MLVHRLQRWPNITPALVERVIFDGRSAQPFVNIRLHFNDLTAELFNWDFHSLEVVSR